MYISTEPAGQERGPRVRCPRKMLWGEKPGVNLCARAGESLLDIVDNNNNNISGRLNFVRLFRWRIIVETVK